MTPAVNFLNTCSLLSEQSHLLTLKPFWIVPSKVMNIHIVLRWVTRCQKLNQGYSRGISTRNLGPVKCSCAAGRGNYHVLYKRHHLAPDHNEKNVTALKERKLSPKYVRVFLKSNNWSALGPTEKTKTLVFLQPHGFPNTSQPSSLLHTWLNSPWILSPMKA